MRWITEWGAALFMFALFGCAIQTGAMENLSSSRYQIDQARRQIDRVMYSINRLMQAPPVEIRDAQIQYAADAKSLRKMTDQLYLGAKTTRQHRIEYLAQRERAPSGLGSAGFSGASEQRRKEVVQSLTNLELSLRGASEGVAPLIAELDDIDQLIASDSTPAGIAAVRQNGLTQAVQKQARYASNRLDIAASRFDRAFTVLSSQTGARALGTAAVGTTIISTDIISTEEKP